MYHDNLTGRSAAVEKKNTLMHYLPPFQSVQAAVQDESVSKFKQSSFSVFTVSISKLTTKPTGRPNQRTKNVEDIRYFVQIQALYDLLIFFLAT